MEQFSLSKLNLYIRRVIAVNFQDPVWINCELLNVKQKSGHIYLELIEKDDNNQIIAQSSAVIWKTAVASIQKNNPFDLFQILVEGNQVLLNVTIDYNARYGLKLIVQDLDGTYTLGKIIQGKIKIIERLKSELLWQKNKNSTLPCAIKNISLITSSDSAGCKDFLNHLIQNHFGFTFKIKKYEAAMQGALTVYQICNAFELIKKENKFKSDLVVIIRGGGSKHDLLEFDDYLISKAISECPYPVFTGIGHFIDESLADLSAFSALKTPTAVADEILHINQQFEMGLISTYQEICNYVLAKNNNYKTSLASIETNLISTTRRILFDQQTKGNELRHNIEMCKNKLLNKYHMLFIEIQGCLDLNDPDKILSKGYSLVYRNGKLVQTIENLNAGDLVETKLINGTFKSRITDIWPQKS